MSMHEYPITDSGLLIRKEEDFPLILQAISKLEEDFEELDFFEFFENCCNSYGEGSGYFFAIEKESQFDGQGFENSDICIIEFQKPKNWFSASYNSIEEMIEEVKNTDIYGYLLKDLLPENFDYKSHLGTFEGTYYG